MATNTIAIPLTFRSVWRGSSPNGVSSPQGLISSQHLVIVPLQVRSRLPLVREDGNLSCSSCRVMPVRACATNSQVEPSLSPQESEAAYGPSAEFYKVEAILRPCRLSHVASSLIESGIRGVTVSDVRGFGAQGGSRERHGGSEFSEDSFVAKVKLEVVVSKDQVEDVLDTIIGQARTGEIGDGKVFITPVADVIRVRTGERGLKAERMVGGRADLLASKSKGGN